MPADLPPPLRRRGPLWAGIVLGFGAIGAGAVVLPMLRLDSAPLAQRAPDLAAPAPQADPTASPTDAAPDPGVPRFDLVRTDADGQTIVAGRAAPHVDVALVVDGVTRAETRSDAAGQFVAFLTLNRSDAARVLWLVARDAQGDRLASDDTVILAPDAVPDPRVAATGPARVRAAVTGPTGPTGPTAAPGPTAVAAPTGVTAAPRQPAAIALRPGPDPGAVPPDRIGARAMPDLPDLRDPPGLSDDALAAVPERPPGRSAAATGTAGSARPLVSDADGVRVLAPAPLAGDALRVDSIAYGAEGAVVLRGRVAPGASGEPDGVVRATLTGLPPAEVTPAPDGTWTLRLRDVAPGDYRLDVARAAAPGDAGTATVTLPFRRAAPADVAAALAGETARIVTVQPGATLWAIARDRYGDGARYVQVFDANRGAIDDPDLIYPGQIFRLPDTASR